MDKAIKFTLYLEEDLTHKGHLIYKWIMEQATALKLPGCTCFRSFTSFGSHQHIHSEGFFELQGKNIIQMIFILSKKQMSALLEKLKAEKIECFYTCSEVEYGVL